MGNLRISCEVDKDIIEKFDLESKSYKRVMVEVVNSFGPYNLIVSNSAVITDLGKSYIYVIEESEGAWGKT